MHPAARELQPVSASAPPPPPGAGLGAEAGHSGRLCMAALGEGEHPHPEPSAEPAVRHRQDPCGVEDLSPRGSTGLGAGRRGTWVWPCPAPLLPVSRATRTCLPSAGGRGSQGPVEGWRLACVWARGFTFIFSTVCSQPSEVGRLKAGETESRAEERPTGLAPGLPLLPECTFWAPGPWFRVLPMTLSFQECPWEGLRASPDPQSPQDSAKAKPGGPTLRPGLSGTRSAGLTSVQKPLGWRGPCCLLAPSLPAADSGSGWPGRLGKACTAVTAHPRTAQPAFPPPTILMLTQDTHHTDEAGQLPSHCVPACRAGPRRASPRLARRCRESRSGAEVRTLSSDAGPLRGASSQTLHGDTRGLGVHPHPPDEEKLQGLAL